MKKIGTPIPDKIKEVIGEIDSDRLEEMVEHLNQVGDVSVLKELYTYFYDAWRDTLDKRYVI